MIDKKTLIELITEAFYMGYNDAPIDAILTLCTDANTSEFKLLEKAFKEGHRTFVEYQVIGIKSIDANLLKFLRMNNLK